VISVGWVLFEAIWPGIHCEKQNLHCTWHLHYTQYDRYKPVSDNSPF
jgi:hypothetical protein